jgi:hypothetical protein
MPKRELLISKENAQEQLDLFFDWYDIDFEEMYEAAIQGENGATIRAAKNKLIKAIRQGRIEVKEVSNDKGETSLELHQKLDCPIFDKNVLVYKEITGSIRASAKADPKANDTKKMYQLLGSITGEGAEIFLRLRRADIGLTDMIGFLFLMV